MSPREESLTIRMRIFDDNYNNSEKQFRQWEEEGIWKTKWTKGDKIFSNNSNGGLRSIGSIFAQQVKNAFPYHFNEFPPDENEVRRYVAEKDLNVDVDRFFDHYYSTGWCNKKGRRLDGWHFALYHCEKTGEWL